jgi:hypothetical protein
VGDKVKYLCESLQTNSTLTVLDMGSMLLLSQFISNTYFLDTGLDNSGLKHLGAALAKNSTLKSLNLQSMPMILIR